MTRKEEREWAWFDGQFRRHYSTMLRLTARQLRDPARAEELPPGLAEGERALLIWFYEEERSCGEIAARLGISESLCRMRLTRARRRCRELWEAQGGPDGSGAKIF